MKKYTIAWSVSLVVIAVVTLIWAICNIAAIVLPDAVIRIMGILELLAIPTLVYTSIRRKER